MMRPTLVHGPLLAIVFLAGCGGSGGGQADHCVLTSDCETTERCVAGVCMPEVDDPGPPPPPLQRTVDAGQEAPTLRIEPADLSLRAHNGGPSSLPLFLIGTYADGTEELVGGAHWSVGQGGLAVIDDEGLLTTDGETGGRGSVTAVAPDGRSVSADFQVFVHRELVADDVDTLGFLSATAEVDSIEAPRVLYPLEDAFMPRNVTPPEIQWAPIGGEGDLFRIRIRKPHAEVVQFLAHTGEGFAHGARATRDAWQSVAASDPDEPVEITVDRLLAASGRLVTRDAPRRIRLARGSMFGKVYYWSLSRGRTETIDPTQDSFEPTVSAPAPNAEGNRCVACHTVSHDGRWLWGIRHGGDAMMYDLTSSLEGDPAPTRFEPVPSPVTTATFDPTGTLLIGSVGWSGPMRVVDAENALSVDVTGLPESGTSFPAWSPSGTQVVFMGGVGTAEDGHPTSGDIHLIARTSESPLAFGDPRVIHEGTHLAAAPEGGTADSHPVWSPDEQRIAFQHGPRTFSFIPGTTDIPAGALYLMDPAGQSLVRLDNANGGPDGQSAYWPAFSPYVTAEAGGHRYYWLAFYSRRDYGNERLGTRGRRQLWVTAVNADAPPGTDPSMVPYRLPGQSNDSHNVSAYWAPEPCRATGELCSTAGECCSGACEGNEDGLFVCVPQAECGEIGDLCGGDEDCCADLTCRGNRCLVPVI